jgi:hypothetical protein
MFSVVLNAGPGPRGEFLQDFSREADISVRDGIAKKMQKAVASLIYF